MRGISRIGVAALAGMVSLLGVSSAQAIEADGSTSLTQPANTLIMPYDATEGKASYMIVSNLAGESAAGPNILTLWEWTNSLGVLAIRSGLPRSQFNDRSGRGRPCSGFSRHGCCHRLGNRR
jgi:hypothetical protein